MILRARARFVCALTWEIRSIYWWVLHVGRFSCKGLLRSSSAANCYWKSTRLGHLPLQIEPWHEKEREIHGNINLEKSRDSQASVIQTTSLLFTELFGNGQVENWFLPLAQVFLTFTLLEWNLHLFLIRSFLFCLIHKSTRQLLHFSVAAFAVCWANPAPFESHWHLWEHALT